jgi:hypothetical protein
MNIENATCAKISFADIESVLVDQDIAAGGLGNHDAMARIPETIVTICTI